KCLDALPDRWSLSIKLKYLMEKESEEICQELGVSPTNFWQIMHRAKLQLRDCVENKWFKD
ncbi:MAG: RNA polymerase subunit sigma, partial [Bacteroidetes bacterium CG_4_10_14_3_um_filter_42_6]